jgi:hypothetical protein
MGFTGEWYRVLHWSPRPFSEALLYFYWRGVHATGRPLVALAVGSAWAVLFIFLFAALKPWQSPGRVARWAMLLALPALFLLAGQPEEMYYWPYGAVAYLPSLGAACFATIRLAGPGLDERRGWITLAVALVIGATSVEHGAFLAGVMSPFLLVAAARGPRDGRFVRLASAGIVAIVVVTVLILFWFGRIALAGETFGIRAIAHRGGVDLKLTVFTLAQEFFHPENWGLAASILAKCMVFVGARHCLAIAWPTQQSRPLLLALLASLAATVFLSVFGAYYNFGVLCCQRMAAYRQALFLLMLVAAAGLSRPARPKTIGSPVLALAALVNLQPRLVAINTEYRLAGARAAARSITFATGMTPGLAPLEYVVPPSGPIFNYRTFPTGIYEYLPQSPGPSQFPMMYFNKRKMWAHDYIPDAQAKPTR